MRPSEVLKEKRELILEICSRYPVTNPRVFGSVAKGTDNEGSDLDILVDTLPETDLFHLGGLSEELRDALGIDLDVRCPGDISLRYRHQVLTEARPL
ncbi:nucleotidyltransferase family protein [Brenneria tiliae]|uniref:nucleotidyltransferase family protein n=1 Tax=Brenneria tiliae TaxID=2914984 RepID=UPI002014EE55|nr:nucleotidyltransferase family protein [Brenneria tiliae]MCL2896808.1 nucleotidyltransferase family protein [Brenneria tiliae]MCL2901366.1 nucleotidyltransferase family protein [Brenneria tiliae]